MPRRTPLARTLLVAGNAALAAALLATFGLRLGERWHHDAAYAALAALAAASWPRLRRRRVATLAMASLGAWSLLTGVALVYWVPSQGGARWWSWWHGVTSAGFALAFLAHWARNNARLVGLVRRLAERGRALAPFLAAWTVLVVAFALTWALPGRGARSKLADRHMDDVTTASLALVGVLVAAALLAVARRRPLPTPARNRLRGAVDASLLATMLFATATGFFLVYGGRPLRHADAHWLVVAWHVVASVLLAGLVAGHATFNRRALASHAR